MLGNGSGVTAPDTVPFCLWICSRFSNDFVEAMWNTVTALGDRDTTCAIVGGIVACQTGRDAIPSEWFDFRSLSRSEMEAFERAQRDLALALRALCARAGVENSFIFDAWGLIWCGVLSFGDDQARLHAQVAAILTSLTPSTPARRQGRSRLRRRARSDVLGLVSCTYVPGVWLSAADERTGNAARGA